MKLFLVRHGETEWNKLGRFQGHSAIAMNERGLAQARETARAVAGWQEAATALYSSPLFRTMQVAQEISRLVDVPVLPEPGFKEINLGDLEGVTGEEMRTGWPEVFAAWRNNPAAVAMPNGESLVQLQERAWAAIEEIEGAHAADDVIVVVSHNFAIRTIISKLLGLSLSNFHRMALDLGSICAIETGRLGWRLVCYNSTCHLSPENR